MLSLNSFLKEKPLMKGQKLFVFFVGIVLCVGLLIGLTSCHLFHSDSDSTSPSSPGSGSSPTQPGNIPGATLVIFDPLTNNQSDYNAILIGGEFTPEGYHITADQGYIMYETDIRENIRVEFDAKGFIWDEWDHEGNDESTIMVMHDAIDPYVNWPALWSVLDNCWFQMIKLGMSPYNSVNGLKLKGGCDCDWGGGGTFFEVSSYYHHDNGAFVGGHPVDWDPATTYHWVVTVQSGHTEGFRDGQQLFWGDGFWPGNRIVVLIGGAYYNVYSPRDVTYSNVTIYRL
jgi:hypothetical protein